MDFYIHESILKPETSLLSFYFAVESEMGRFFPHHVIDNPRTSILNINSIVAAIQLVYKKWIFKNVFFYYFVWHMNYNLIIRICVELLRNFFKSPTSSLVS